MAISRDATAYHSGNQSATNYSYNHTTVTNTRCVVAVITGYDSTNTDPPVTGVTLNSVAMSKAREYITASGYGVISIWYLPMTEATRPTGAVSLAVTHTGKMTDSQCTSVNLVDSAADTILFDSYDDGTGSGSASAVVNPAVTGSYAVGGGVAAGGTPGSFSVSTGTEISGSEVDMGSECASAGEAAESGGSATITWTYSGVTCYALAATFYSAITTVTLEDLTGGETTADTTPELLFHGHLTKAVANNIDYQLQVATNTDFNIVPLATSSTVDISTLTTSYVLTDFTFTGANQIQLENGKKYFVVVYYGAGDGSNNLKVSTSESTGGHGGNEARLYSGSWDAESRDLRFYVYSGTTTVDSNTAAAFGDYTVYNTASGGPDATGQSFTGNGNTLTKIAFYLKKLGSPTGNLTAYIYGHTGTYGSSGVPNTTVSCVINSLSTDALGDYEAGRPWDDAEQVTYTVQSALTAGTYYWRVRGKDVATGVWGAWSTGAGSGYDSFVISAGGTNMQVNIGDAWKNVSSAKINIGDSWKTVTSAKVNIGDTWKTIF